jgi:hypothetical protein
MNSLMIIEQNRAVVYFSTCQNKMKCLVVKFLYQVSIKYIVKLCTKLMDKITYMPHIIFLYFCPNLTNILSNFVAFSGRIKHVDLTSRAHSHPKNLLVFVRDSEGGRGGHGSKGHAQGSNQINSFQRINQCSGILCK